MHPDGYIIRYDYCLKIYNELSTSTISILEALIVSRFQHFCLFSKLFWVQMLPGSGLCLISREKMGGRYRRKQDVVRLKSRPVLSNCPYVF